MSHLLHDADSEVRLLDVDGALQTLLDAGLHETSITTLNNQTLTTAAAHTVIWGQLRVNSHPAVQSLTISQANAKPKALVYTPEYPALKNHHALHFYDTAGRLQHRVLLENPKTIEKFRSLPTIQAHSLPDVDRRCTDEPRLETSPLDRVGNVDHALQEVMQAREEWDEAGPEWHLAHIQQQGGKKRAKVLKHLGGKRARRVDPRVLLKWLHYTLAEGLTHSRLVLGKYWSQTDGSVLRGLGVHHNFLIMHSAVGATMIDLPSIDTCWETRFHSPAGRVSFIELYSHCGHCIAVFAPFMEYLRQPWTMITASLPDA
ncbi:MAG: hypothetical protein AAF529_04090 [Pseudomonadota bacterium]